MRVISLRRRSRVAAVEGRNRAEMCSDLAVNPSGLRGTLGNVAQRGYSVGMETDLIDQLEQLFFEDLMCEVDHQRQDVIEEFGALPTCGIVATARVTDCTDEALVCRSMAEWMAEMAGHGTSCGIHQDCLKIQWL